jgi:adenylate cyclase
MARGHGIDFEAVGLLEGVEGEAREARRELLEHLHRAGVPLEELERAVAEERLTLLPAQLVLAQDAKYTVHEVAERAGIPVEFLLEQRRAAGLPVADLEERAYSDDDVEAGRRLAAAVSYKNLTLPTTSRV